MIVINFLMVAWAFLSLAWPALRRAWRNQAVLCNSLGIHWRNLRVELDRPLKHEYPVKSICRITFTWADVGQEGVYVGARSQLRPIPQWSLKSLIAICSGTMILNECGAFVPGLIGFCYLNMAGSICSSCYYSTRSTVKNRSGCEHARVHGRLFDWSALCV